MLIIAMMSGPMMLHGETAFESGLPLHSVRVAAYNIEELSREKIDAVDSDGRGEHPQLLKAAEVIQRVRPDILLINEIDFDDADRANARLFQERYLRVSQSGQKPVEYTHIVFEPVNTGVPARRDFNNNDRMDDPEDAYGYGHYPGQYGMALYSRFPVERDNVRTFRMLLWKDMPDNFMPDGRGDKPAWYNATDQAVFRLSSKSHWDVPVRIGGRTVHLLASHPTPPVFDGPEDRNGRRNFDEIRLWADYIAGGKRAGYLRDDRGHGGGLPEDAAFVILGDLNAEPVKDPVTYGVRPIDQLLKLERVHDPQPHRRAEASVRPSTRPATGLPHGATFTSDFGRIDYVLPSRDLRVIDSGVYRPPAGHPEHHLTTASDHFLVWVDVELPEAPRGE